MYKKRINDWQLHKNCKASVKEEILRSVEANRELGVDLGEPIVNGRTVKMHIIERHRKEKRRARSPGSVVTNGLSTKRACRQRAGFSASISFSRIEDPTDYRNCENLLFQIDQYYNAKLENDAHVAWDAWKQLSSRVQQVKISYIFQGVTYTCAFVSPWSIFSRYRSAVELLRDNRHSGGWRMIQEGAEMVRPVLRQQSPEFITELLSYLSAAQSADHDGLKMQLLRLISGMATIAHGDRHPISILCQLLQTLHGNQDAIRLGMSKLRDVLRRQLGQTHLASIFAQQRISSTLLKQRRYDESERAILDLVSICEHIYGRNDYHTRDNLFLLAGLYYEMRRDSQAEGVLVDVLRRGKGQGDNDRINISARGLQGDIYFNRGDYRTAEVSLWSVLSGTLLQNGPRDPGTVNRWVKYKKVATLLKKHQKVSNPLAAYPEALPKITDEPLRCRSRNRTSNQPRVGHRGWRAGFCYEAPV
jgi:hypothetical protein